MRSTLLALMLLLPALVPAQDAPKNAPKDATAVMMALRSPDKDVCQQALDAIPTLPGYPASAQDLMPALLWMADGQDADLAAGAEKQAQALGWPKAYCLECVGRMARREDAVFKMMGLAMLAQLAWRDPAAMAVLLDINRMHPRGSGTMIRAFTLLLRERPCPNGTQMDAWNRAVVPYRQRMLNALHGGGPRLRTMAQSLLACDGVDPLISAEAQAVLAALPTTTPER